MTLFFLEIDMFPNTVIIHRENEIFEIHQRTILRPDFLIFDSFDLTEKTYYGKDVQRLYVMTRDKTKEGLELAKSIILRDGDRLEKDLHGLRDVGFEYVIIVAGGRALYESRNVSSSKSMRTEGELRSIMAHETGDQYTIRKLLAAAIDTNHAKGKTFKESIQALEGAGIFGDCIIHYKDLNEV